MRILEKKQLSRDDILITNLYSLIQEHQINEAELSRRTGIPQPTLHKILSGKTTDPRISTLLQTLASYFNITLDNLFSDNVLQSKAQIAKAISIPIFFVDGLPKGERFNSKVNSQHLGALGSY